MVDYVKDCGIDAECAAKHLLTQAVDRGSQDNVTVVIAFFEDGPLVRSCKSGSGAVRRFLRNMVRCRSGLRKLHT